MTHPTDSSPYDEEVDGLPVLADEIPAAPPARPGALSPAAVQTAAVVGAGVVAGAAVMAVAQRRRTKKLAKRQRRALGTVMGSRSFLVDVHVLGDRK